MWDSDRSTEVMLNKIFRPMSAMDSLDTRGPVFSRDYLGGFGRYLQFGETIMGFQNYRII